MQRPNPEIVTLNDILITKELSRRAPRSPNWQAEAEAMRSLAAQMARDSVSLMQTLVDTALELCQAGTAGVSLLETTPNGEEIFRWTVLAGTLAHHVGGSTPRSFSPCGVCLEQGSPVLLSYPERYFTYFQEANTPIVEGLVLPLVADRHVFGTIWIMSHDEGRHFDSEDVRLMTSLADFTATALLLQQRQIRELLAANAAKTAEIAERKQVEARTQALISNLPGGAAFVVDRDLRYLLAQGEALSVAGFKPEDFVGRTIFEVLPPELATEYETLYRQGLAGEPFEHEHSAHNRSFISRGTPLWSPDGEVYAVLAVSYDISDRKRHEEYQAFLLKLSDALRPLSDPLEIQQTAMRVLGDYLKVDRTLYAEIEPNDEHFVIGDNYVRGNFSKMIGRFPLSDYGQVPNSQRVGETLVLPDINDAGESPAHLAAHLAAGVRAIIGIPLCKDERWVASLTVHHGSPRQWTPEEVAFVSETAERTWAAVERARAEESLRESEEKYRSLFNSIDEGFVLGEAFRTDDDSVDFRYETVNPAWEQIFGIQAEDVVGRTAREVLPGLKETWYETVERVGFGSESINVEEFAVPIGKWLSTAFSPIGPSGEGRLAVLLKDVTERKRHEANLAFLAEVSQDLARLTNIDATMNALGEKIGGHLDLSACAFAELDEAAEIGVINHSWHRSDVPSLVGAYRMEEFVTPKILQRCRAGEAVVVRDVFDDPLTDGEQYAALNIGSFLSIPLVRDGEWRFLLVIYHTEPYDWRDDEIEVTRELANRIWTRLERARAEVGLSQSEEKYRLLFNSINEGYALCELLYDDNEAPIDWKILEVNPAFESLTGFTDAAGKTARELNQPLNANWLQIFGTVAQTGEAVRFEGHIGRTEYWYEISVSRIDNDKRHIVVVFNDISDRKRAEAERIHLIEEQAAREEERQRAETLAELDRAKTAFFSNVSHEFRTPLTLLLAPLQDALSDRTSPLPLDHQQRLEIAHRSSLRLLKLVNTLLDFARIEAGRIEAAYEPTDLAQLTTELASVFRSTIEQAGLQLIVDCPPLPEAVYVEREMWEKIVLNLISNAFKFTLEGEIRIRLQPVDHHVIFEIQDTGSGIEPEELPHLFERFYQVRGTQARSHEGSGIGLALVHELVQLQGGTINVSSTPGQGTCFTIALPFGSEHLPPERIKATCSLTPLASEATPYVQEAELWLSSEQPREISSDTQIFVVDDNADMRDYLTRILGEQVQVEAFADGATALLAAQTRIPDLILTDVMMPGLDGFELLHALRADSRTREIPIILLSARAGEESIAEGLEAGADDYLIKPFSAQELVSRVNAHLQMSHLRGSALREARTAMRRKDELLSVVSHELNTPLLSILGWTRLLRSNPSNSAMLSKALDTIERSATMQAKLVQDLLDVSRIIAGKLRLNLQPTEVEAVIEAAIATVTQLAAEAGIHLIWTETTAAVVMGDRERLQQVVCNFLTNAIKFTPKGGRVDVCLSLVTGHGALIEDEELVTNDNYAEIRVTDTGIGIAADFLPHVFEQFRQAEGSTSAKGLGLGLAIAQHLVELHNGTIHAQSAGIGQGATFIVRLPLLQPN